MYANVLSTTPLIPPTQTLFPGQQSDTWCMECHQKMTIKVNNVKVIRLDSNAPLTGWNWFFLDDDGDGGDDDDDGGGDGGDDDDGGGDDGGDDDDANNTYILNHNCYHYINCINIASIITYSYEL